MRTVTRKNLLARINRRLHARAQALRQGRSLDERHQRGLHIVELVSGHEQVLARWLDLETLARRLGVLWPGETLEETE